MTNTALANYEQEQALFTEFIASDAEPNILLFQGESGSGKSHFIEHCLQRVPETPSVLMKLQSVPIRCRRCLRAWVDGKAGSSYLTLRSQWPQYWSSQVRGLIRCGT